MFEIAPPNKMNITGKGVDFSRFNISNKMMEGRVVTFWALPEMVDVKILSKGGSFSWDGNFMISQEISEVNGNAEVLFSEELDARANFMQSLDESVDVFLKGVIDGFQDSKLHLASLKTEEYLLDCLWK
jgi:hypothetical protein